MTIVLLTDGRVAHLRGDCWTDEDEKHIYFYRLDENKDEQFMGEFKSQYVVGYYHIADIEIPKIK